MIHYIDKAAVAEVKDLYEDIDKCIGDLVLARSKHDQRGISDAHWKMETLVVNTKQVLSYILQHLEVKEVDLDNEYTDEIYSHIDSIKDTADRMTSGNFMHNRAAIKFSANTIAKVLELMGLKVQKGE